MIIFDTSALFGLIPDDSKLDSKSDLLRALKRSGQQRVSIPWMVREELVAQRVLRHAEAHNKAATAIRELNKAAPWISQREPAPFNRSEARDYWRRAYNRVFEVVETSGDVAREALLREANRQKPAKGQDAKEKGGARDAAIWLSVVEYLKSHPEEEEVYFVTENIRDFGDGSGFPSPMAEDVEGLGDRLTLLTSFDSVVSTFSEPLEIDEELIQRDLVGLLTSDAALALLQADVRKLLAGEPGLWGGNAIQVFMPAVDPTGTYRPVRWRTWSSEPRAMLRRVLDVSGHKIGEEAWYTATVDWILVGMAPAVGASPVPQVVPVATNIACQWRTKLLFSNKPEEPPTILGYWPPQELDPAGEDEWRPLVRQAVSRTIPEINPQVFGSPVGFVVLALGLLAAFAKKKREGGTAGT